MRQIAAKLIACTLLVVLTASTQAGDDGLISVKSAYDTATTTERLVARLKDKGMTIFTRVDHSAEAKGVGLELAPTELIIFGNPKAGTRLMQCGRGIAIDLPLKALVWEDEASQTWLTYNEPTFLGKRHQLKGCDDVLVKIDQALSGLAKAVTQ